MNERLRRLLCSCVSQRRAAIILGINRKTVVKKFRLLALDAEFHLRKGNLQRPMAISVEFDDLETFEHTKFKPLSVTIAVESKTRRILGFEVSRMGANGRLANKSGERYGPRPDERRAGRHRLFRGLKRVVSESAVFRSDSNPYYSADLKKFFPAAKHETVLSRRGAITAGGELKKQGFDPIFSINHTCAMLRDSLSRLKRKTWCTTKRSDCLRGHIALYAQFHNETLIG